VIVKENGTKNQAYFVERGRSVAIILQRNECHGEISEYVRNADLVL